MSALHGHREETKAHYPNAENDGVKYEGFHYVVSLFDEALAKPEFDKSKVLPQPCGS